MNKHTPGPWKIRKSGSVGTSDVYVAEVFGYESQEANKHLIAAAPELLDALQALVDYHSTDYEDIPEVEQARKVIAKIKGE